MSVNSSSSSFNYIFHCTESRVGVFISNAYIITRIFLLLPISILVLYLGHQQWRQQRSIATANHSDIFTCNLAAMELISALGNTVFACARYTGLSQVVSVAFFMSTIVLLGQLAFNILTSVERYLAVIHPITYLRLKQSGGVKIRNITTVCVWLLCFGWSCAVTVNHDLYVPPLVSAMAFSLIVVSFCSLRVASVLIRPGPREVGGDRERVDLSKQRAFHTIMAIMGVLGLWFIGSLVCLALESSELLGYNEGCVLLISASWFNLPSSLVLPLLFLHRAGKLLCCCQSSE